MVYYVYVGNDFSSNNILAVFDNDYKNEHISYFDVDVVQFSFFSILMLLFQLCKKKLTNIWDNLKIMIYFLHKKKIKKKTSFNFK